MSSTPWTAHRAPSTPSPLLTRRGRTPLNFSSPSNVRFPPLPTPVVRTSFIMYAEEVAPDASLLLYC